MSTLGVNRRPKEVRVVLEPGQVVNTGMLINVLKRLSEALRFRLTISGATSSKETDDGMYFEVKGGAGDGLHAWKLVSSAGVVTVHGGSCGGVEIDDTEFSTTDDRFYLKITFSRTISSEGSYLRSAYVTAVELLSGSTIPASGGDFHYLQIGRVVDGKVTTQDFTYSFGVGLCDRGTGDGEGQLQY